LLDLLKNMSPPDPALNFLIRALSSALSGQIVEDRNREKAIPIERFDRQWNRQIENGTAHIK
jgi:hypothetical protein